MRIEKWLSLTNRQRHVLVLAMQVRNALETFHAENLSDAGMHAMNMIIRQALFDAVVLLESDDDLEAQRQLDYLVAMIPDYWEIPGEDLRLVDDEGRVTTSS